MAKSPIKLKVASPCSANWNEMEGDDAMRHCGLCDQKVYQISHMSSEQVEDFLLSRKKRGLRTCVRFYQRADGTLLTNDCSVGKKRKRKKRVISAFGGLAVGASAVGLSVGAQSSATEAVELPRPSAAPLIVPAPPMDPRPFMGEAIEREVIEHHDVAPTEEPLETIQGGIEMPEAIEMLGDVAYE